MYLVGSRGLAATSDYNKVKETSDWDFVLEQEEASKTPIIDISSNDLMSEEICRKYSLNKNIDTPLGEAKLVHPICIMLFKRSHLHRPLNFAKHIVDYHWLKERYYSSIDNDYLSLLNLRTKLTKKKFGDRTPSLKQSKNSFFDDYVKKVYDHDGLHYCTCYGDKPLYERLKPDNDLVWCDKNLWDKFTHEEKTNCVREECYVLSLERFIIPKIEDGKIPPPPHFAFDWSLEKICTTTSSGYFRDFAIENWPEIRQYKHDFYKMFLDKKDSLPKYGEI